MQMPTRQALNGQADQRSTIRIINPQVVLKACSDDRKGLFTAYCMACSAFYKNHVLEN